MITPIIPQSKEEYLEDTRRDKVDHYTVLITNQGSIPYVQSLLDRLLQEYHADCKMVYGKAPTIAVNGSIDPNDIRDILGCNEMGAYEKLHNIKYLLEVK